MLLHSDGTPVTLADMRAVYLAAIRPPECKRVVRFPGIVEHAKALGVSRIHLYFVLTGQRSSPRIEAYARRHISAPSGSEEA